MKGLDDGVTRAMNTAVLPESSWGLGLSPKRAFLLILAGCSLLRVGVAFLFWHHAFPSDGRDYVEMAHQLAEGRHFLPYWPPGLPLYLSMFVGMGVSDAALRISMLSFWLIFSWGLWRLGKDLGIERYAWLILLAIGCMPAWLEMSVEPMTQIAVAALFITVLSSAVRCLRGGSWREYVLFGVGMGWMTLIRPSTGVLVGVLPLMLILRKRRWQQILAAVVLASVIVGAWVLRAHTLGGEWSINSSNTKNIWYGNNPRTPLYRTWYLGSHSEELRDDADFVRIQGLTAAEKPAAFQSLAMAYIRGNPGKFLLRTINRVRCYWGFDTFTALNLKAYYPHLFLPILAADACIYLMIMGGAVFWIAGSRQSFWQQPDVQIVVAAVLVYAAPYWISMSHPTYHFPAVAPIALLGVAAWIGSRNRGFSKKRAIVGVVVLGLIQFEWVWMMAKSLK